MGLTAGPVPARVDATVKAGLLALTEHAISAGGWSLRQTAAAQDGGEGQGEGLDGAGRGFDRQGLCSGWFGKDVTPQML